MRFIRLTAPPQQYNLHIQSAVFIDHKGKNLKLPVQQAPHTMTEGSRYFCTYDNHPDQTLYQQYYSPMQLMSIKFFIP